MCCFLQGDLCSIYEERPDFCDFKRAYGFLGKYMTEEEYRAKTILHCEQLKKKKIENENLYKQQK
jgi:Fe-S-cluster containining protein